MGFPLSTFPRLRRWLSPYGCSPIYSSSAGATGTSHRPADLLPTESLSFRLLTDEWDLFLVPAGLVYGVLRDALLRVQCPFGISTPPRWENGAERLFNIIWLERNQTVPARVSRTLVQAEFPSVGQLLLKPGH